MRLSSSQTFEINFTNKTSEDLEGECKTQRPSYKMMINCLRFQTAINVDLDIFFTVPFSSSIKKAIKSKRNTAFMLKVLK